MPDINWQTAVAVVSFVLALFAYFESRKSRQAAEASADAAKKSADAGGEANKISERTATTAEKSLDQAKAIFESQKMLSQRQLLVPLWNYMTSLNRLDADNPNVKDVLNAVHTLELVALCCEGGMVDELVIKRTFRDVYIMQYDQIASCKNMPSLARDGKALLRENPAAMKFYEQLKQEHMNRDQLGKV